MTIHTRAAAPAVGSLNVEARTVDLVFSTESPVRRTSWETGAFDEVLVCTAKAIDTTRLNGGMTLLDSHRNGSNAFRLGSILPGSLRIAQGQAIVTAKFSRNPTAEALFQDLIDGHILPISVGYSIEKEEVDMTTTPPTVRATRWTPLEISVVQIPADPNAKTRQKEATMADEHDDIETPVLTRAELKRQKELRKFDAFARSRFPNEYQPEALQRSIDAGTSVEAFRDAMIDHIAERQERAPTFPVFDSSTIDRDTSDRRERDAMRSALVSRLTGVAPSEESRQFVGRSLLQLAEHTLQRRGVNTSFLNKHELLERAMHSSSDFPVLLQGVGERVMLDAYEVAKSPIRQVLTRTGTMSDFRKKTVVMVGELGLLERLSEKGEITSTTRAETSEGYKLETFARMFSISRQALINDDLGAFSNMAAAFGQAAGLTENILLFSLLNSNPVMAEDNTALFHANHGNLAPAGTSLNESALSDARKAMRNQRAFGNAGGFMSLQPAYLLVGPELETQAEKLLRTINPTTTADVSVFAGRLELLVEPQIQGSEWYVFSRPAQAPVLEISYLDGHQGPTVEMEQAWSTLGASWRAFIDMGVGVLDYRGAYKNPGL
nr:prohead protease/major capsid protein fusion protein [uncultured Gellertiella sp.]